MKVPGRGCLWNVDPGDSERLPGFKVGDWVRLRPSQGTRPSYDWNSVGKESIAVIHSVQDSGYLELAGCFRKGRWLTHYMDVQKISSLKTGYHVRFRRGLVEPRWGWRGAHPDSRGIITSVHADGEVRLAFVGVSGLWKADPADLEREEMFEIGQWVNLQEEAPGWKTLKPGSVGIVQGIGYNDCNAWDGTLHVGFCGEQEKWVGEASKLEKHDGFLVGQRVRMKNHVSQPRFGWSGHNHTSDGTISSIDADGKLRIYTPVGSKAWMIDPTEVDRVEEPELCVGDWVRVKAKITTPTYQWGEVSHTNIGVVHRKENGDLWVAFCFLERLWMCKEWEMEKLRAFVIGDKVKIKPGLLAPRWGWGVETFASKGEVMSVDANGKLKIKFKWRSDSLWVGDPADVVLDDESVLEL